MFFGRNDAEAETPIVWPPHAKSWLIGKDSVAGRDWGQEEKGTTEDQMAGWHHWLDGRESEWTPGVGDGQGGLACWNSWGRKESDMIERLNWLKHWCAEFCVDIFSSRLWPRSEIAGSYSKNVFTCVRYCHAIFQKCCTSLHFYQHCLRVPCTLHLHLNLILSVFHYSRLCHFIVVFFSISLIDSMM